MPCPPLRSSSLRLEIESKIEFPIRGFLTKGPNDNCLANHTRHHLSLEQRYTNYQRPWKLMASYRRHISEFIQYNAFRIWANSWPGSRWVFYTVAIIIRALGKECLDIGYHGQLASFGLDQIAALSDPKVFRLEPAQWCKQYAEAISRVIQIFILNSSLGRGIADKIILSSYAKRK